MAILRFFYQISIILLKKNYIRLISTKFSFQQRAICEVIFTCFLPQIYKFRWFLVSFSHPIWWAVKDRTHDMKNWLLQGSPPPFTSIQILKFWTACWPSLGSWEWRFLKARRRSVEGSPCVRPAKRQNIEFQTLLLLPNEEKHLIVGEINELRIHKHYPLHSGATDRVSFPDLGWLCFVINLKSADKFNNYVPFHESFSRLSIVQTLRDLPSAFGLTKTFHFMSRFLASA